MSDDADAIAEIVAVTGENTPRKILHYLYVSNRETAAEIAKELERRGFCTEERLSSDGENWLVLASHVTEPSIKLMTKIRHNMEILATKFSGEYDGWEAEVRLSST